MKKWEDIVKEKMEEPDRTLPESILDEFRARRNGETVPVSKRHIPGWVMIPAVAAGLAVALFIRKPSDSVDIIRTAKIPANPVAGIVTSDSTEYTMCVQNKWITAQASTARADVCPVEEVQDPEEATKKAAGPDDEATSVYADNEKLAPEQTGTAMSSPFSSQGPRIKTVNDIKIIPAVGAVAGGGLIAALLLPSRNGTSSSNLFMTDGSKQGTIIGAGQSDHVQIDDMLPGTPTHYFPIRVLLSTRIPVSDRLCITTGLDYSLYSSSFPYSISSISGEKKQFAHYVGLPVRLDWILASNRWLDVYVGGGIEGDFCVAAKLGGNKIKKDGFSISLLGVGGIQFNASKRLGIFVEPEISWTVPSENRVLTTYRTEHPLMFSVVSGIRINIGKNNNKQ